MIRLSILLIFIVVALSGCDWVDGAGDNSDRPVNPDDVIVLDDPGQVVRLEEGETKRIDPAADTDANGRPPIYSWDAEPESEGSIASCSEVEGFDLSVAAISVQEACADAENCEIFFAPERLPDNAGGRTVFSVSLPEFKAPVGAVYKLNTRYLDGTELQENYTLCMVAINTPPIANDDSYRVSEGMSLVLSADDTQQNLLRNDTDDTDVRNLPLRVVVAESGRPALDDNFVLGEAGDLTYTPNVMALVQDGQTRTDSFEYTITDGTSTSTATVLISITASDGAPNLVTEIDEITAFAGIPQSIVFDEYFSDPEGAELSYTITSGSLPGSGNFTLSNVGVLSGTADDTDIESWQVTVIASDGVNENSTTFTLTVKENLPPEITRIPNQNLDIGDSYVLNTAAYFEDPEGSELTYSLDGADDEDISIGRNTGLLQGSFRNPGTYRLTITADDDYNDPVSSVVTIFVGGLANRSPIYAGDNIDNLIIEVREEIDEIEPEFSDPDGDRLVYSMIGTLPAGITLNPTTGVISGASRVTGSFTNLKIKASDPAGESATTNGFSITVNAVVPNRAPTYSGDISNKIVELGDFVTPFRGSFIDPDGDDMTFSIDPDLAAGLFLDEDTGEITGEPARLGGATVFYKITATDPDGETAVSDSFRIYVVPRSASDNRPPVFRGGISSRTLIRGVRVSPFSGDFSDPDANDQLTFSQLGVWPRGVTVNTATGIVGGIPLVTGPFRNLRIVATDQENETAQSNLFGLFVDPP